jgi:Transmembrane protein 43
MNVQRAMKLVLGVMLLAAGFAAFWFSGRPANEIVADPLFGVSVKARHLRRKVEMYQWKETAPGNYSQIWSEQLIDSSTFKTPSGHMNPPIMPFRSEDFPAGVTSRGDGDPVDASQAKLPLSVHAATTPIESGFEIGNPASPRIGNLRVTFQQSNRPRPPSRLVAFELTACGLLVTVLALRRPAQP